MESLGIKVAAETLAWFCWTVGPSNTPKEIADAAAEFESKIAEIATPRLRLIAEYVSERAGVRKSAEPNAWQNLESALEAELEDRDLED